MGNFFAQPYERLVKPVTDVVFRIPEIVNESLPIVNQVDKYYKMDNENRGKLIIFNHKKYSDNPDLDTRPGTDEDVKALDKTFTELDFQVDTYHDRKKAQIIDLLKMESNNESFYKDCDCLVIAVLTHGHSGDKLCAFDKTYKVNDLWKPFTASNCPALAGKPKVLILQACRGANVSNAFTYGTSEFATDSGSAPTPSNTNCVIPDEADMLIVYSTFAGYVSYREETGSSFIQELCKALSEYGKAVDMSMIITRVNNEVGIKNRNLKKLQMPTSQNTLTRILFFGEPFTLKPVESSACSWQKVRNRRVPHNAVVGGWDKDGGVLYIIRAEHKGDVIPGWVSADMKCGYVSYFWKAHEKPDFEVLCCPANLVQWVEATHGDAPPGALQGGLTRRGDALYVGRVHYEGALTPGKVHRDCNSLLIPFEGKEKKFRKYELLFIVG